MLLCLGQRREATLSPTFMVVDRKSKWAERRTNGWRKRERERENLMAV